MRRYTRILLASLISTVALFSGCTNRAPSLRMLDTRAGYDSPYDDEEVALYQKHRHHGDSIGRPMGPRIARVYVFPHELPSQDYFWGGFVSLVIHRDEVVFDGADPENTDSDDGSNVIQTSQSAPLRTRPKFPTKPSLGDN
jgi:hypothetical protein